MSVAPEFIESIRKCCADGLTQEQTAAAVGSTRRVVQRIMQQHGIVRRLPHWRDMVREEGECLIWTGRLDKNGYGKYGLQWAHRRVYEIELGPITAGMELDHTCNTPPCVNPSHLQPVTHLENLRRAAQRRGTHLKYIEAARLRSDGLSYDEISEQMGLNGYWSAQQLVAKAVERGLVERSSLPGRWAS